MITDMLFSMDGDFVCRLCFRTCLQASASWLFLTHTYQRGWCLLDLQARESW